MRETRRERETKRDRKRERKRERERGRENVQIHKLVGTIKREKVGQTDQKSERESKK